MPAPNVRARPPILRALGQNDPPSVVTINGHAYQRIDVFKHDSWAATALYRGSSGDVVVKFHRQHPLGFFPAHWLGRYLAARERRARDLLNGIPGIARDAGPVNVGGAPSPSATAHFYIEGRPLHMDDKPSAEFFARLQEMFAAMHFLGFAYVDCNKRENIIVTTDGAPALVDFQLHFAPARWSLKFLPVRLLLNALQSGDVYHLQKHKLWHRPDLVPAHEHNLSGQRPIAVQIWRSCTRPFILLRRRILVSFGIRTGHGLAVSEIAPEHAARLSLQRRAANPAARLPGEK